MSINILERDVDKGLKTKKLNSVLVVVYSLQKASEDLNKELKGPT